MAIGQGHPGDPSCRLASRVPATDGKKSDEEARPDRRRCRPWPAPPAQWAPPVWLAGPAAVVFILATGLPACVLSWSWARDSYTASIVTDRLLASDRTTQRSPLPDSVAPPEGGWMISTPATWRTGRFSSAGLRVKTTIRPRNQRLFWSALFRLHRSMRRRDWPWPSSSRLNSTPSVSLRSLGLSRDAVSLAWSARRLMAAGKKEDALKLYGRALSVALPERVVSSRRSAIQRRPGCSPLPAARRGASP